MHCIDNCDEVPVHVKSDLDWFSLVSAITCVFVWPCFKVSVLLIWLHLTNHICCSEIYRQKVQMLSIHTNVDGKT